MKNYRNLVAAAVLVSVVSGGAIPLAQADQLKVPVGSQAERSEQSLPANGMSEDSVRNRWGAPQDIRGPVGEPPISQWHYQDFVVYFEGSRVIHAVMKQKKN